VREMFCLTVGELAFLSKECLPKSDLVVTRASSLTYPVNHSILFAKNRGVLDRADLSGLRNSLILVPPAEAEQVTGLSDPSNVIAPVVNPRLSYARLMSAALSSIPRPDVQYIARNGAIVAESASIPPDCVVEPGVFIDHGVTVGARVQILSGAVIRAYTTIGDGTIIRERAVIGSAGFGFERDENGVAVRLPHVGGVQIGCNVEIGALSVVCSGTIDPTVVKDGVKIDNFVQVSHNCVIGTGTMIAACADLSGSVHIGDYSWIAPNSTILESRHVGDRATVGIGAVVLRDIDDDGVVAGNPARAMEGVSRPRGWGGTISTNQPDR